MMQPDLNEYDDQPYLSPNRNPDYRQGDNQYYSPSQKRSKRRSYEISLDINPGECLTPPLPTRVNMNEPYFTPKLDPSRSSLTFNKTKGSCSNCANILVYITGVSNTLIGFFLASISLAILVGGSKYELLGEGFFAAVSGALLAGFLVAFCSIILMVAVCNRTKPSCKAALIGVYIVLVIIFLLELTTVGLAFWSHSVIASPADNEGRNVAANWLLARRDQFADTTYHACCVAFKPPYSGANATKVDKICTWPESTQVVKDSCSGTNVLVCVCENGPKEYVSSINFFLRQYLTYIASTWMVIAAVLLAVLVTVCALKCSDNPSNKHSNVHTDMDPPDEAVIYAN